MPPTLGAALLCSSRAGSDMWLLSRNFKVHWGWTIGVCVCSFIVVLGFVELYLGLVFQWEDGDTQYKKER